MKGIVLSIALLTSSIITVAHADFVGRWCWDNNSDINAFSVVIHKAGEIYKGSYSAVAQRGNKIDDNDSAFSFKVGMKSKIRTRLAAGQSRNSGLIELKLPSDHRLEWSLLKAPIGEIYIPKFAVLHRC
jgi:hypothetical protein